MYFTPVIVNMLPVVPIHTSPLPKSPSRSHPRDSLIQIIDTRDHVILQKAKDCLWCSKETGLLKPSSGINNSLLHVLMFPFTILHVHTCTCTVRNMIHVHV